MSSSHNCPCQIELPVLQPLHSIPPQCLYLPLCAGSEITCIRYHVTPTLYLFHRSREPLPRTKHPKSKRIRNHNAHCNRCIIQRLRADGVLFRQHECNRDERDPHDGDHRNGQRQHAQVEGSADEAGCVRDAQRNRDTVRNVETYGSDGRRSGEGDRAA